MMRAIAAAILVFVFATTVAQADDHEHEYEHDECPIPGFQTSPGYCLEGIASSPRARQEPTPQKVSRSAETTADRAVTVVTSVPVIVQPAVQQQTVIVVVAPTPQPQQQVLSSTLRVEPGAAIHIRPPQSGDGGLR